MKISDDNILEFIKKFKYKEKVLINCDNCEKDFYRTKKDILDLLNKNKNKSFCTRDCFNHYQNKSKLYNCLNCNEKVLRTPSKIENNIFCSNRCSATYNNKIRGIKKRNFSKLGIDNIKKSTELKKENNIIKYNVNPKLCRECNIILEYNKRTNTFCSYSCKAKQKRISFKRIIIKNKYKYRCRKTKISRECKNISCTNSPLKRKSYCEDCKFNYYKIYKPKCFFKFNINQYKNYISGFEYIQKLGWYSPTNRGNNLNGASMDHMYSIKEGFINGIDPKIIKHPANCRILPHSENNLKNTDCYITYQELLDRIKLFDNLVDLA